MKKKKNIQKKRGSSAGGVGNQKTIRKNSEAGLAQSIENKARSFQNRFLSDYAIPFTRLVEAKLISLQHKS